ncbi:hypothetical protein [Natrononativus amylolyticus]|uniref:hypothetical protein n=1 Tax=Natrononativus amylolyticus TaxID=2963434 RepID=UPI0020CF8B05|nr:hypothetical protein [Natrononativus amylolyticus]
MTQNPFTPVFEAQRTALEQSRTLTHDAVAAQQATFGAIADAMSASDSLVEQNAELTKGAAHAYIDALEATIPEESVDFDDLRELVDEQFDAATDAQRESLESLVEAVEESEEAYEQFAGRYTEAVDTSFDSFLEAHEQAEANVESVVENVEDAAEEFDTAA